LQPLYYELREEVTSGEERDGTAIIIAELGTLPLNSSSISLNAFHLFQYKQWCMAMDQGKIPSEIKALLTGEEQSKSQQNSSRHLKTGKTDASSNSCE
jgi:hypothetical protein